MPGTVDTHVEDKGGTSPGKNCVGGKLSPSVGQTGTRGRPVAKVKLVQNPPTTGVAKLLTRCQ